MRLAGAQPAHDPVIGQLIVFVGERRAGHDDMFPPRVVRHLADFRRDLAYRPSVVDGNTHRLNDPALRVKVFAVWQRRRVREKPEDAVHILAPHAGNDREVRAAVAHALGHQRRVRFRRVQPRIVCEHNEVQACRAGRFSPLGHGPAAAAPFALRSEYAADFRPRFDPAPVGVLPDHRRKVDRFLRLRFRRRLVAAKAACGLRRLRQPAPGVDEQALTVARVDPVTVEEKRVLHRRVPVVAPRPRRVDRLDQHAAFSVTRRVPHRHHLRAGGVRAHFVRVPKFARSAVG